MAPQSDDDPRMPIGRGDRTALLVIDMLNSYDHPDGEPLRESAETVVPVIADLLGRAREEDVPVVHVNDNHGMWGSRRDALIADARSTGHPELIDPILPAEDAPFIFKARHSIFYGSPLEYFLETNGIGRLVMTGQVTEQCVLYSALDAYIRHFQVVVPRDAVAHIDPELAQGALRMMQRNMRAEVEDAAAVRLRTD
ncbi:cysteine hydrolase family protein [Patulibacter sp. S7RM1-6]